MEHSWQSTQSGRGDTGVGSDAGAGQNVDVIRPPAIAGLRKVRFLRSSIDKSKAWRPWLSFGTGKTYWANSITGEVQWEKPAGVRGSVFEEGPLEKSTQSLKSWEIDNLRDRLVNGPRSDAGALAPAFDRLSLASRPGNSRTESHAGNGRHGDAATREELLGIEPMRDSAHPGILKSTVPKLLLQNLNEGQGGLSEEKLLRSSYRRPGFEQLWKRLDNPQGDAGFTKVASSRGALTERVSFESRAATRGDGPAAMTLREGAHGGRHEGRHDALKDWERSLREREAARWQEWHVLNQEDSLRRATGFEERIAELHEELHAGFKALLRKGERHPLDVIHDMLVDARPAGAPMAVGPREMLRVGRWLGVRMTLAEAGAIVQHALSRAGQGKESEADEIGLDALSHVLLDPARVKQETLSAAMAFLTEGIHGVRKAVSKEKQDEELAAARAAQRRLCVKEGVHLHARVEAERKRDAKVYRERRAVREQFREDAETAKRIKIFFQNHRSLNDDTSLFKALGSKSSQSTLVSGMIKEWQKLVRKAREDALQAMERVKEATRKNKKGMLIAILTTHIHLTTRSWMETLKAAGTSLAITAREGDQPATECARRLLRHEDPGARALAANLLSKLAWSDDRAAMEALNVAHHDPESAVRRAAKKASAEVVRRSKVAKR